MNRIHTRMRKILRLYRSHGVKKKWNTFIWSSYIPRKYSFCAWRAIRGRLSTQDRLSFLNQNQVFVLCDSCIESHHHLYFECSATKMVCDAIKSWLHFRPGSTSILSAIKWCEKDHKGSSIIRKSRRLALTCTIYFIWYHRNLKTFQNINFEGRKVINSIKVQTLKVFFDIFSPPSCFIANQVTYHSCTGTLSFQFVGRF